MVPGAAMRWGRLCTVRECWKLFVPTRQPTPGLGGLRGFFTCAKLLRCADALICKGGASITAGTAALVARKPLIIWHEMFRPERGSFTPRQHLLRPLRALVVRYAYQHVAVSQACLDSQRIPPSRPAVVIHNPVLPEIAAAAPQSRGRNVQPAFDILFVGRMVPSKGVGVLVQALLEIERSQFPLRVCLVGDGEEKETVATGLRHCEHIRLSMKGELRVKELVEVYKQSRCLVLPNTHPEGMGLVFVEALAFGLPVITADHPGVRDIVGDAALTFPNRDASRLARTIQFLLNTPAVYQALSAKAAARARQFSFSAYVKAIREHVLC